MYKCKVSGCDRNVIVNGAECVECCLLLKTGTQAVLSHRCEKHNKFWSTGSSCPDCLQELQEAWIRTAPESTEPVQSARYNEGKVQTREIDPNFILGIGEVLTKSRAKYDHYNWCKPTKLSTPYESMMRHIMAFQSGEDIDPDDNCSHLLKAATNIMFMYYHITNNPEESDDRFFKKDKKK